MIVLVLHPTEQFKISEFQKNICNIVNSDDSYIFPQFPLWFPLPEEVFSQKDFADDLSEAAQKNNLKKLSNTISKINIEINKDEEKKNPQLKLNFFYKEKQFASQIPLFLEYKPLSDKKKTELYQAIADYKKNGSSELFPMSLKIFRIAKAVTLTEKSQGLQSFVWKKLK